MKKNLFLTILIGLWAFVNCKNLGLDKNEEDLFDKKAETFLLLDDLNKTPELLEINGKWKDNYNSYHKIFALKSSTYGTIGYWEGVTNPIIVEFDNITKTLYVKGINEPIWADCNRNGTNGESGVECYSRIVWTNYQDSFYFCEIVYNKGSLDEAKNDPTIANPTNPALSGCSSFPWTKFTTKLD